MPLRIGTHYEEEDDMKLLVGATLLAFTVGAVSALAQTPDTKMTPDQKKAISKSCSEQANAKGLHGKERRKFRAECKRAGGKPSQ
jgi:hypothetical protein